MLETPREKYKSTSGNRTTQGKGNSASPHLSSLGTIQF